MRTSKPTSQAAGWVRAASRALHVECRRGLPLKSATAFTALDDFSPPERGKPGRGRGRKTLDQRTPTPTLHPFQGGGGVRRRHFAVRKFSRRKGGCRGRAAEPDQAVDALTVVRRCLAPHRPRPPSSCSRAGWWGWWGSRLRQDEDAAPDPRSHQPSAGEMSVGDRVVSSPFAHLAAGTRNMVDDLPKLRTVVPH